MFAYQGSVRQAAPTPVTLKLNIVVHVCAHVGVFLNTCFIGPISPYGPGSPRNRRRASMPGHDAVMPAPKPVTAR